MCESDVGLVLSSWSSNRQKKETNLVNGNPILLKMEEIRKQDSSQQHLFLEHMRKCLTCKAGENSKD